MPRLHYSPSGGTDTLCGVICVSLTGDPPPAPPPPNVDCRLCLRRWREAEQRAAAAEGKLSRWETFHFRSQDNPHISTEALGEITRDMSNLSYRQEIVF